MPHMRPMTAPAIKGKLKKNKQSMQQINAVGASAAQFQDQLTKQLMLRQKRPNQSLQNLMP